jgi:hypothetical protein
MDDDQILMRGATDRDIQEYANQNGADLKLGPWNDPNVRWVCESHPAKDAEHGVWSWRRLRFVECGGAGMPEPTDENRRKGYIG